MSNWQTVLLGISILQLLHDIINKAVSTTILTFYFIINQLKVWSCSYHYHWHLISWLVGLVGPVKIIFLGLPQFLVFQGNRFMHTRDDISWYMNELQNVNLRKKWSQMDACDWNFFHSSMKWRYLLSYKYLSGLWQTSIHSYL